MSHYSPRAAKDAILDQLVYPHDDCNQFWNYDRDYPGSMVQVVDIVITSRFRRTSDRVSTLGNLDSLPIEVLYMIMSALDVQTLSRFKKTCIRGHEVVESFPELRSLTRHARTTLIALARTQLLRYHTVETLHAALLAQTCMSCQESFGQFIFLPSAERCCYACLENNRALWVIPVSAARRYFFNVDNKMLARIPIMRSIPGEYGTRNCRRSNKRSLRLVSVKAVKQLALDHGVSKEQLLENVDTDEAIVSQDKVPAKILIEAPLEPIGKFPTMTPKCLLFGRPPSSDSFCGMASLPFPSVSPGNIINRGLLCRGCDATYWLFFKDELQWQDISHLVPSNDRHAMTKLDILGHFRMLRHFEWSEGAFLEHLPKCAGARKLWPDLLELLPRAKEI